jgi:Zn finger protein HypA/HybF involved in hydrogenase expression/predicted glutamine amidotransferase
MCIAIYKPAAVDVPSKKTLKNCWDSNSMGAGFAWWIEEEKVWQIKKGYMTWKKFWKAFNHFQYEEKLKDVQTMIHFRISTSGVINGECCTHPFPITDVVDELNATDTKAANILIHNGVVGSGEGDLSDTQVAARDYVDLLVPMLDKEDPRCDRAWNLLNECLEAKSNRWMVARGDNVWKFGKWIEDEDIYYSNDDYKGDWGTYYWKTRNKRGQSNVKTTYVPSVTHDYSEPKPEVMDIDEALTLADFMNEEGLWDWKLWYKYVDKDTRDDKTETVGQNTHEVYDDGNNLIALVNDNGEVIWDVNENTEEDDNKKLVARCLDCDYIIDDYDYDMSDGMCPECGKYFDISCIERPIEDIKTPETDDIKCLTCGYVYSSYKELLSDAGECMQCGTVLDPVANEYLDVENHKVTCPYCEESRYIIAYESSPENADLYAMTADGKKAEFAECCRCGAIFNESLRGMESVLMWNPTTKSQYQISQDAINAEG